MQPLVSVVVPIYNVEKFLPKCLDSILIQDYPIWEAILVDDGSPDSSGEIAEEYVKKDKRFKVIHQKNGGLSAARNTGLDVIQGKYVMFLDGDDWWLSETMVSELVEKAESGNWDIIVFGADEIHSDCQVHSDLSVQSNCYGRDFFIRYLLYECYQAVWNKFYRTWLWKGVRFPSGLNAEDLYILPDVLCKTEKIFSWERYWYGYNQLNDSSISKSRIGLFNAACYGWEKRLAQAHSGKWELSADVIRQLDRVAVNYIQNTIAEMKSNRLINEKRRNELGLLLCRYGSGMDKWKALFTYKFRYPIKTFLYHLMGKNRVDSI